MTNVRRTVRWSASRFNHFGDFLRRSKITAARSPIMTAGMPLTSGLMTMLHRPVAEIAISAKLGVLLPLAIG